MLGLHSATTWRPPSTRTMPQGNTRKCTAKRDGGNDVFVHVIGAFRLEFNFSLGLGPHRSMKQKPNVHFIGKPMFCLKLKPQ
jgi:hypothetical protein